MAFGLFKEGAINNQNEWTGKDKISKLVFHSGSQSFTPGYGTGGNATYASKVIDEPLSSESLWFDVWINPADSDDKSYGAALFLTGKSGNSSEKTTFAYLMFKEKEIAVNSWDVAKAVVIYQKIDATMEPGAWSRLSPSGA